MRKGPAKTSYAKISTLKRNVVVSICDAVKNPAGHLWYLIKFEGSYGFVDADYITVTKKL